VRPITPIDGPDGLRLVPAGPTYHSAIIEGINESGNEIFQAMPWLELSQPIPDQVSEYLHDVERYGNGGLSYHWVVEFHGEVTGLIALDYTPHLVMGHWNMGYWIRPQFQRKGLAGHSIDTILNWIGRGGLTSVEMAVNPANHAGVRTAESAVKRWGGHQLSDEVEVEIAGQKIIHNCWLIPRLPLEGE